MTQIQNDGASANATFPFLNLRNHSTALIGTSGSGRSRLAECLGLAPEQIVQPIKPTLEQEAEAKRREAATHEAAARRLAAVREAIWSTRCHNSSDLDVLCAALRLAGGSGSSSEDEQKALFDLLPEDVIGKGIAWGFSDTEVRDSIYTYVEENLQAVTNAVFRKKV